MPITPVTSTVPSAVQPTPLVANPSAATAGSGLSFSAVLDAVNPLQHIPVVSSLYRAATGAQISSVSQVAGDTLYGALLPGGAIAGLASSLIDVGVKQVTGQNIGQIALSAVTPASPSAPSASASSTNSSAAAAVTPLPPVAAVPLSAHAGHSPSSQYQRAQTLDKINNRLIHMTS